MENKETLIISGNLVQGEEKTHGGRIYPFPKKEKTNEELARDAVIASSGVKPENFDELPVIENKEGVVEAPKPQAPEMTKEQIKEALSKELGREITDKELELIAKKAQYKTLAYPKFPIEFKEMRGMLFHLFSKSIVQNGEHKKDGIHYKGTCLSLKEVKNNDKKDIHYVFTNKKRALQFSIKNGGEYDFKFEKGGHRQLRRLINESFLEHFNKIVELEKLKAKAKEAAKEAGEDVLAQEYNEIVEESKEALKPRGETDSVLLIDDSMVQKEGDVFKVELSDEMTKEEAIKVVENEK